MLYDEFVKGTGCKETPHNYDVYKKLEIIYMADDTVTKEQIYEWGKKLVDNSKTEAELALEKQIKDEIAEHKAEIDKCNEEIRYYTAELEALKGYAFLLDTQEWWKDTCKRRIKYYKGEAKFHRAKIRELKFVFNV